MRRLDRSLGQLAAVAVVSLGIATLAVAILETVVGVPNASIVYLAAVVVTAFVAGTLGAVVASVAAFLLYDFLFTQPLHTLTISDPEEWLSVILLLFVGIVVGQLTALQRSRTEEAHARELEARALFAVSRELATRESTTAVLPTIARLLHAETRMERVWISLVSETTERTAADSANGDRPVIPAVQRVLRQASGDDDPHWMHVHRPGPARLPGRGGKEAYRIRLDANGISLGSIWALRDRREGDPDGTETRLLAAAADQLGQALAHDRLAAEAQAAEIAQRSDELKSALLQSVSHDLRTPLATIRAAAGTLRPSGGLPPGEQEESANAIDREVEYLNRMVTNLLDLSRIEAGALRPERDVFDVDDLLGRSLERLQARLAGRSVEIQLDAPPVEVDPIFVDEAVTNAVENAIKYTAPGTQIRVSATPLESERFVRVTIEDAGPGVPPAAMSRLFEKFYRVPGSGGGSRAGTGIGLAVVRGLIEATGGRVAARRSELGGLAIDIDLPVAIVPAELAAGQHR